jgi:hypothetical protein
MAFTFPTNRTPALPWCSHDQDSQQSWRSCRRDGVFGWSRRSKKEQDDRRQRQAGRLRADPKFHVLEMQTSTLGQKALSVPLIWQQCKRSAALLSQPPFSLPYLRTPYSYCPVLPSVLTTFNDLARISRRGIVGLGRRQHWLHLPSPISHLPSPISHLPPIAVAQSISLLHPHRETVCPCPPWLPTPASNFAYRSSAVAIKSISRSETFHPLLFPHIVEIFCQENKSFYLHCFTCSLLSSTPFVILFIESPRVSINMSEAPKPVVDEPVSAPVTETPAVEPVPEVKATEEPATDAPVTTEPAATEEAAPVKEEVKPVEEGVLGYKAPGLLK